MDIVSGLSAASQAVNIVKEIRALDRSVDEASFKLKLADLTDALAETRIALSDAKEKLAEKDSEIRVLERKIESALSGETCPICQSGRLKTKSVTAHPTFGEVGGSRKEPRMR